MDGWNSTMLTAQSQPRVPCWLLRLPPSMERQFFQESSVQGVYVLLDVLAISQALLLNWNLMRKFGGMQQEESVMAPLELWAAVVFFVGAVLQMVCIAAWPQQYRVHRHRAAFLNRVLRLLITLVCAGQAAPARAYHQVWAFQSVFAPSSTTSPSQDAFLALHSCLSTHPTAALAHPAVGLVPGRPGNAGSPGSFALWKGLLMYPIITMLHANWLVPFWVALAMQAVTFVASLQSLAASMCATLYFQWPASASILPACQQLSWLLYAAGQLLDWQVAVDPEHASTAGDVLCADPVVALVLLQVWVRLVLLVLVPCGLVYCLERSLKAGFLETRYAGSDAAAASAPGPATEAHRQAGLQHLLQDTSQGTTPQWEGAGPGGSSEKRDAHNQLAAALATGAQSRAQRRQQQHLRLQRALRQVQPASVGELLAPGPGCGLVRILVGTGLALSAVLFCLLLCEVVLLALLEGGWQFVCGADGWLRLQ